MLRTLYSLSVSLVAAGFLMVAPVSAEPQFSRAPGEFTPINDNNNDRVCCHRGNSDWWSARNACQWAGGHATDNRQCQQDGGWGYDGRDNSRWNERQCCVRNERGGYRVLWSTVGECHRTGGEGATNKTCRKQGGFHAYPGRGDGSWDNDGRGDSRWNERQCCKRNEHNGYRIIWSTVGECRRTGGEGVTNKTCRKYGGFHPYSRW